MKVILCKPDSEPKVVEFASKRKLDYKDLKNLLGIESPITVAERKISGKYYDLWLDDEGLLKGEKTITGYCRNCEEALVGNIVIANRDDKGNTVGLTDEDIARIFDKKELSFLENSEFIRFVKVFHPSSGKFEKKNAKGEYLMMEDYNGFGEIHMNENGHILRYNV